jgi:hypothetical protein
LRAEPGCSVVDAERHSKPGQLSRVGVINVHEGGESALGWEAVPAFEAEHGIVLRPSLFLGAPVDADHH